MLATAGSTPGTSGDTTPLLASECQAAGTDFNPLDGRTAPFFGVRFGQRFDAITGRRIYGVTFPIFRVGSVPGAMLTMTLRLVGAGDTLVASRLWGDVDDVPTSLTDLEVLFPVPITVNEEIRLLMEWSGPAGDASNFLRTRAITPSVEAQQNACRYDGAAYTESLSHDATYCYSWRPT